MEDDEDDARESSASFCRPSDSGGEEEEKEHFSAPEHFPAIIWAILRDPLLCLSLLSPPSMAASPLAKCQSRSPQRATDTPSPNSAPKEKYQTSSMARRRKADLQREGPPKPRGLVCRPPIITTSSEQEKGSAREIDGSQRGIQ